MDGYREIYPVLPNETQRVENFQLQQSSQWLSWFENELRE